MTAGGEIVFKTSFQKLVVVLLLAGGVSAGDEIPLRGGVVSLRGEKLVASSTRDLNFVRGFRAADGTIYLSSSIGVHTVDEQGERRMSRDGGNSWETSIAGGFNAFDLDDGRRVREINWVADKPVDTARITIIDSFPGGEKKPEVHETDMKLPFPFSGRLCSFPRRAPDGTLLAAGYGRRPGSGNFFNFACRSNDDGANWEFLSVISEAEAGAEGPSETGIETLADGSVLAVYRVAGNEPLRQKRSFDGGRSWGEERILASAGAVMPCLLRLSDGTLALLSGRPGITLSLDFGGVGDDWQPVELYRGPGSSYGTIVETSPGKLLVLYDESNFSTGRVNSRYNRIFAVELEVRRGGGLSAAAAEREELLGCTTLYHPAERKLPGELGGRFNVLRYQTKPEDPRGPYLEIVDIPERPTPVLRMVSRHATGSGNLIRPYVRAPLPSETGRVELKCSFRLLDAQEPEVPQFLISVRVAGENGGHRQATVQFAADALIATDARGEQQIPFAAGVGTFHDYRLVVDGMAGEMKIFVDGKLLEHGTVKLAETAGEGSPEIIFGDGSTQVRGAVEVEYIGWNN